ncbi:MAG: (2Fe-2S)-binding protein [bacterium]
MIVCICEGVSDRDVRDAARRGADSLATLQQQCGAGGDCGQCRPELRRMLRQHRSTTRNENR